MRNEDLISRIESECLTALASAGYTERTPSTMVVNGSTDDYTNERLTEMKRLLKKPSWVVATDHEGAEFDCLAVTKPDADLILAYDPKQNEYCVIQGVDSPYSTIGIWGDPVGCFIAM